MPELVNIGTTANDGTGDQLRDAFNTLNGWADEIILGWAADGAYSPSAPPTRDSDQTISSANIVWNGDGSAGVYTRTVKNATFGLTDSYTVTHALSGKTVTQPTITRDSSGRVSIAPALTIS